MSAEIVGLTVFKKEGKPGVFLSEMSLIKGLGVEGDFHQGGEKQVTILTGEARRWMERQPEQGLCFRRFQENILIKGFKLEEIYPESLLSAGSAVLRISMLVKPCFDECSLSSKGTPCRLSGRALFAVVERGGTVRIGDSVILYPT